MAEFTGMDVILASFGVNCTSRVAQSWPLRVAFYLVRVSFFALAVAAGVLQASQSSWTGELAVDSATSMLLYLAVVANQQIWISQCNNLGELRLYCLDKMNFEDKKLARLSSHLCLLLYFTLLILLFSTNCNSAFFELTLFASIIIYTHLATCVHLASTRVLNLASFQSRDLMLAGLEVTGLKKLHERITNLHPLLWMALLFAQFHLIVKLICRSSILDCLKSPTASRVIACYFLALFLWFLVTYLIQSLKRSQEKTVTRLTLRLLDNVTHVIDLQMRDFTLEILSDAAQWHLTAGHMVDVDSCLIPRFTQAVVTFTAIFLDVLGLI